MSQWADDSMTPSPLKVTKDKFGNELAQDRPSHNNTTAEEGSFHFGGNQYDDSPGKGGFGSYGVAVEDYGQNPKVERSTVDNSRADRGRES